MTKRVALLVYLTLVGTACADMGDDGVAAEMELVDEPEADGLASVSTHSDPSGSSASVAELRAPAVAGNSRDVDEMFALDAPGDEGRPSLRALQEIKRGAGPNVVFRK